MPLPLILGIAAAAAGAAGLGSGIHGGVKMKKANDRSKEAEKRNQKNTERFNNTNTEVLTVMDNLGKFEMEIISSFKRFSDSIEKINNRPDFQKITNDITINQYTPEDIKKAAVGAAVLLGGLGGAALGTAGGFAAAGGTTAAVMALGTASTGTAIASLSGAAATNATLAALGGGSLAAGGGGIALGTAVLGGATLGVGLLVGGLIFNMTGSSIQKKAEEAYAQMLENEETINKVCEYLRRLRFVGESFTVSLKKINRIYLEKLSEMEKLVEIKNDWNNFSDNEKMTVENVILLVHLLYEMCKVQVTKKAENEEDMNVINEEEVNLEIDKANRVFARLEDLA